MNRPRLGVNIDHVATLRQVRREIDPDPVWAAVLVELAGADGVVVHLREDRRHIQDRDLELLRQIVKIKLNLEMAAADEMVEIACRIRPDQVTLVPERREELTTEGGLDVVSNRHVLKTVTEIIKKEAITVSFFVEPDPEQIKASKECGADAVEIHTGTYANATGPAVAKELDRIKKAAAFAKKLGLHVHAGHGLTYRNVEPVAAIPEIEELNIGHNIIARAVFVGLQQAVREMIQIIEKARL